MNSSSRGELVVVLLGQPDAQQLPRVVPLVQRLAGVDALVALQSHERRVEHRGQRLGRLGLADPRFALEQQRLRQPHRAEHRRRETEVGQVGVLVELPAERVDRRDEFGDLAHAVT